MSKKNSGISPELRDILSTRPTRDTYDVWSSSSTGHQQSDGSSSQVAAYMRQRAEKLGQQFGSAPNEQNNRAATSNQSSNSRDGNDIRNFFGGVRKQSKTPLQKPFVKKDSGITLRDSETVVTSTARDRKRESVALASKINQQDAIPTENIEKAESKEASQTVTKSNPKIFDHLTVYINGSTYQTVSDHKLKNLLVSNGATLAFSLARRSVTHVILGKPSSSGSRSGAGGGLAAGKFRDEVRRAGSKGVKYISAEWSVTRSHLLDT